jgi:lambda repressor-like predicted transcriptional regulator
MSSAPKTARREHSDRDIAVILALHAKGYSAREISRENGVPKSTINAIENVWRLLKMRIAKDAIEFDL